MSNPTLLSFGAVLALGSAALSQCSFNVYPLRFVDAQGVLRPVGGDGFAQIQSEAVYLAFDPALPSGNYYVHVTDTAVTQVLSANDPMDRIVAVTNNAGVITLALPYTQNPDPTLFGLGLNGQGQSLRLGALNNAQSNPCEFKVWAGDTWDPTAGPNTVNVIIGPYNPLTNQCTIKSYAFFRIGDGSGTDVLGSVFVDDDRDGVRDPGEGPAVNWQVRLVTPTTTQTTTTDVFGNYLFVDVPAGSYSVELVLQNGWIATNTSTASVAVLGCANAQLSGFGVAPSLLAHDGHTIGYWRNNHGLARITQYSILPTLVALNLRNASGALFAPTTNNQWKTWLQGANSVNMAYMLSAQLAAMHCNVMVGFVDAGSVISDPTLGNITIGNLMAQAIASLALHGFTPVGHPERAAQQVLKNALDNANNNLNWL